MTVKDLHDKMLNSVNVKRSMPPNAWLWLLIENCQNQDDIHLLFDVLQNLRRFVSTILPSLFTCSVLFQLRFLMINQFLQIFVSGLQRLSNLRIHDNFNCNLCQQVAKTCVRVGAIDSGTPNFDFV